jgi:hypothetical protein
MGFYIIFTTLQYRIREEIKHNCILQSNDPVLVVFKFPMNDLKPSWINDREFRLNGKLYDVIHIKKNGDCTIYYCLNDESEEKLFASLDNHIRDFLSDKQSSGKKTKSINFGKIVFFIKEFNINYYLPQNTIRNAKFLDLYKNIISEVLSPPPEIVII